MRPKRKSHTDQLPLAWQPQVGDRVTLGTETIYTVTRASQDGSDVDLQTPGTNLYRYRVPIGDLKPVDPVRQAGPAPNKPAKPFINMEELGNALPTHSKAALISSVGTLRFSKNT